MGEEEEGGGRVGRGRGEGGGATPRTPLRDMPPRSASSCPWQRSAL